MDVFSKSNASQYSDALYCEAEGLSALSDVLEKQGIDDIRIPEVIAVDEQSICLRRIAGRSAVADQLKQLGEGLAALHSVRFDSYGYESDNYIGLSPQRNAVAPDWGNFFLRQRLTVQVGMIRSAGIREQFNNSLRMHADRLIAFLNTHCDHPSLVHGDLWTGNVMFDADHVWLIDPAVYRGDREVDIAMTEMFGGFGNGFLKAYDSVYPRSAVYPLKREIYNLYHYLNHYNLFGSGYLAGCERGFEAISQLPD